MIILTPNRRLSAFSRQQFNVQQLDAKKSCWQSLEIYPIDVWILQLWQLCLENDPTTYRPVLNKQQQQLLFEQIIQQNSSKELLRINATAENALQAWKFLRQWQVDVKKIAAYAEFSEETREFYLWLQLYLDWLDKNQYYDFDSMLDVLISEISSFAYMLPKEICLRGFNELTPQYAKFVNTLKQNDVNIITDQLINGGADVYKAAMLNQEQELETAALWARNHLEANPNQIIGVVIPDLEQQRQQVVAAFTSIIPYAQINISAPLALLSYTMIDVAILLLQLAKPIINFSDLSIILRSPFIINYSNAYNQRAKLDRSLREVCEAKLTWYNLIKHLQKFDTDIKDLAENFKALLEKGQGEYDTSYWVEYIQTLLNVWGWPGNRGLTVEESHLLSCWRDLLLEYHKLDCILGKHTFAECLQAVQRLASETPFLPAETGLTRIHVLGLLEADGLNFDQLWICGMNRDSWPMPANPNPFIPLELQKQYDMPRSSPQRELLVAQKLTANLMQGAKFNVIFSYAKFVDDREIQPSSLLADVPEITLDLSRNAIKQTRIELEVWHDPNAPKLNTTYLSGGTRALQLQAQCPFKANAELRLNARPLEEPQNFLTPKERGSLVHEVLEQFWHMCKSLTQLKSFTALELESKLFKIIEQVLLNLQKRWPLTLTNNYILLESQRLYSLISRWLEYEAGRLSFVVYSLEQKHLTQVGPLQINLQIDRIDQLIDGTYLVIDYKTGNTIIDEWFTDPIYAPQIPLYAVYAIDQVAGAAIATLRPNNLRFLGVSEQDGVLPDVKSFANWSEQKQTWRERLERTAQELCAGHATVTPYSNKVCSQCNLHAFCRIYAQ